MTNNIVTMRRVEVRKKDDMEKEFIFPKVEEEEEEKPEEAWLNAIPVEKKDTNLGNVLTEKEKEKVEKNTFTKHKNIWKKRKLKEERTSW